MHAFFRVRLLCFQTCSVPRFMSCTTIHMSHVSVIFHPLNVGTMDAFRSLQILAGNDCHFNSGMWPVFQASDLDKVVIFLDDFTIQCTLSIFPNLFHLR